MGASMLDSALDSLFNDNELVSTAPRITAPIHIENDISCFFFLVLYPLSCVFAREYGFRGFLGCGFV